MFQKSEVEGYKYQDDSYIHSQPFPEMVLEEQEIYSDHNGYQQQYIKHGSRLASHSVPRSNISRANKRSWQRRILICCSIHVCTSSLAFSHTPDLQLALVPSGPDD
jgi:hypothetical protein